MHLEFKKSKSSDNISVTGLRILTILRMLFEGPCSEKEINEKFKKSLVKSRVLSKDTIQIYLNTLRSIGCEISRPTKKNRYKYSLKDHPFKLNLSEKDVNCLINIRRFLVQVQNWRFIYEIDCFCQELMKKVNRKSANLFEKEKEKNLAREVDINSITKDLSFLEKCCKQKKTIVVDYYSPENGYKNIELTAEKIIFDNEAYYLCGFGFDKKSAISLRLDRIKSVKAVSLKDSNIKSETIAVRYRLEGEACYSYTVDENEEIIERNDDFVIIEAKVSNKFKFMQKILSYSSEAVVLSPDEIKKEVVDKLTAINGVYEDIYLI